MIYELSCEYHKWIVSSVDTTYITLKRIDALGEVPFTKYEAKVYKLSCKNRIFTNFTLDEKTKNLKAFMDLSTFTDGSYSFGVQRNSKNNAGYKNLRTNKIKMYIEKFVAL